MEGSGRDGKNGWCKTERIEKERTRAGYRIHYEYAIYTHASHRMDLFFQLQVYHFCPSCSFGQDIFFDVISPQRHHLLIEFPVKSSFAASPFAAQDGSIGNTKPKNIKEPIDNTCRRLFRSPNGAEIFRCKFAFSSWVIIEANEQRCVEHLTE